jgi:hypothetical protein
MFLSYEAKKQEIAISALIFRVYEDIHLILFVTLAFLPALIRELIFTLIHEEGDKSDDGKWHSIQIIHKLLSLHLARGMILRG